jgi:hypothetical protein
VFLNWDSGAIASYSRSDTVSSLLRGYLESTISHSSTEAEIKAIDMLILELLHILDLARFIAGPMELPIKLYTDNKSAIALFETLRTNHKVKHINMRIQFIRDLIVRGIFAIYFVPTEHNVADMLTKPLGTEQFGALRNILMLGHGGVAPQWASGSGPQHHALIATSFEGCV